MTPRYSTPQPCKASGTLPFFHLCTHCSFLVTWLTSACPSKFSLEVTSFKSPSLTPIVQFSQTGLNAPILMLIYCHCLLTSSLSIILKGKDRLKYSSLRLYDIVQHRLWVWKYLELYSNLVIFKLGPHGQLGNVKERPLYEVGKRPSTS